jgi:predicted RNA-binding Zn ribbon-like protein
MVTIQGVKNFEFIGGALCLDFVNTIHLYGAEDPGEELCGPEDLTAWAARAGILTPGELLRLQKQWERHPDQGKATIKEARSLRANLRSLFQRTIHNGSATPSDVDLLNGLLQKFPAAAKLEGASGEWQMQWRSSSDGTRRILFEVLKSAAELVSGRLGSLRECASPTCTWMFLDTSKNHTRRWCDMRACGNREKIQRFRARVRKATAPS